MDDRHGNEPVATLTSSCRRKPHSNPPAKRGSKRLTNFTIAENLDQLSHHLIHLIHTNQHHDPAIMRYFSPILESVWQCSTTTTGLPAFLAVWKAFLANNRSKVLRILNTCAIAEKGKRTATAWVTMTAANLSPTDHIHVRLETVCKLDWQHGGKGWVCVRHTSMRAPAFVGF